MYRSDGTLVSGELLVFDHPDERFLALNRLEGFDPGQPSLYQRVLIPAQNSGAAGVLAWAYVIEEPSRIYLSGGRWPS